MGLTLTRKKGKSRGRKQVQLKRRPAKKKAAPKAQPAGGTAGPQEAQAPPAKVWPPPMPTRWERFLELFQEKEPFIGPVLPQATIGAMAASVLAQVARSDPMPLRDQAGGYYTAEKHPDILHRQYQLVEQFAPSGGGTGSMPRWVAVAVGIAAALILGIVGFSLAPGILGASGVAGSGGSTQQIAPYIGLALGVALGAGLGLMMLVFFGRAPTGQMWPKVYAKARISQVAYVDPDGRPCDRDAIGAERVVIRRMRTWLQRMAFADRQQGIFVQTAKWKPDMDLFRDGEIRLETTKDLSQWTHPSILYDGEPLGGNWRGVNSVRWWVQLREPIETGKETAIYDSGPEGQERRRLIGNAGFWILAAGLIIGMIIFFNAMDASRQAENPDPVDRTPATPAPSGWTLPALTDTTRANDGVYYDDAQPVVRLGSTDYRRYHPARAVPAEGRWPRGKP